MNITLPDSTLVVLMGPSGAGKSTFARRHFKPTEVLSSDYCRGLVSDDQNDQGATADAFAVLHFIAGKRLANRRLTVIDATNVQQDSRKSLVALARANDCLVVAIVLNIPEKVCRARNNEREDRVFGAHVVRQQSQQLRRSLRGLKREGFRNITVLNSEDEVAAVTGVERRPLWNNRREETGPFDIIGDIHGCYRELTELLTKLGYVVGGSPDAPIVTPPQDRRVIFVGDLVDRGPNSPDVLRLVMSMVQAGTALCVPGNHEAKLRKWLIGKNVNLSHGLAETVQQMALESAEFRGEVSEFIYSLVSHYVLDGGRLVVSHAGLKESYQGRASGRVRQFCLYGETTGETDEFGFPVRYDWASEYRGKALVVYGHTPVPSAEWVNRTICLDTGCVFGGTLTALRYPERELVDVPAHEVYYEPVKPLVDPNLKTVQQRAYQDLLDIDDVLGKRVVSTELKRNVTIREENAAAALEVMSRFAVDPRWLIYLPPTMSPSETCNEGEYLEHPTEAFRFFRRNDVSSVICEEKHMGSRAVVVVCRDESVAARRFGISDEGAGVVYTRTGRTFLKGQVGVDLLDRVRAAADATGFWERFDTDWLCLDAELMPWSVKAQELLRTQYAAVGAASRVGLAATEKALRQAVERTGQGSELLESVTARRTVVGKFVDAYRHYCWKAETVDDLRLAPFHLLATEGRVYTDENHVWHMDTLAELCAGDDVLQATEYKVIDLDSPTSEAEGVAWWESMTHAGGEGMVVKPMDWVVKGKNGLVQPAVKCRGREYLRIIYGPEYTLARHLERLRSRSLGRKRSLALREFALGLEGLQRFVAKEPLYRVHECVFGVLALESEPVDPRL